ncbi:MAG: flavodoxin [Planctomycetota bacterium]
MAAFENPVLLYGSCTGKTEYIAELIVKEFEPTLELEMVEISSIEAGDLAKYDLIVCGIPTWDIGELEHAWQEVYEELDDVDLNGVRFTIFGLGDQRGYSDTYQDAMGILYKKMVERGAAGDLGFTTTDGHEFDESLGIIDGKFCGLALDEDNQDDLSEVRIKTWAKQVLDELSLVQA